ncbi:hypothetical protein GBAR_LOCUS27449 [Geodia barretti]|uniref:Uncharacterized protein n=1 Tax=Geodia barretti TaxID=519541 RepID=A0AA35TL04_GEOBA|nr:hypothetical protein GBAR_LOCUS27449 [Geodia barretti]
MATGGGTGGAQVCPLCNVVVEGGDQLQLHYLTSCAGYDLGGAGVGGDSRGKSPKPSPPPTTVVATASAGGATPGGTAPGNQVLVQFMWQPLTQMSYPKVTLLTSLGSGSIDLTIEPEGGHYCSEWVAVSSGTYEGQLVVGDSFINPVKAFSVGPAEEQIVVLEFEVSSDKGFDTGAGDMYMQENPSFNLPYSYEGAGGSYHDRDSPSHRPRRGKVGVAAGGDTVSNFDHRHHFKNEPSYLTTPPVYAHTQTTPPGPGDHTNSHRLTEEGFDPVVVKTKSGTTREFRHNCGVEKCFSTTYVYMKVKI